MTTSTDRLTITLYRIVEFGHRAGRTAQRTEISPWDCKAIVDASGLTGRVIALEQASDKARKAEIGESRSADTDHQQLRADLRGAQAEVARLTEMRLADALARSSSATARAENAEADLAAAWGRVVTTPTDLHSVNHALRQLYASMTSRAEKAEAESAAANATIDNLRSTAYATDERLRKAQAEIDRVKETCKDLVRAHTAAIIRAQEAEVELATAVALVRKWSALYGGTVYEVVGTGELLARHGGAG